jgi:hypothetical protein
LKYCFHAIPTDVCGFYPAHCGEVTFPKYPHYVGSKFEGYPNCSLGLLDIIRPLFRYAHMNARTDRGNSQAVVLKKPLCVGNPGRKLGPSGNVNVLKQASEINPVKAEFSPFSAYRSQVPVRASQCHKTDFHSL